MAAEKFGRSRCGLCRFYCHEGRRGGTCSQLNVSVSADLDACCLSASPFCTEFNHDLEASLEASVEIAKQEASKFVANDTISIVETPVKLRAVSAA